MHTEFKTYLAPQFAAVVVREADVRRATKAVQLEVVKMRPSSGLVSPPVYTVRPSDFDRGGDLVLLTSHELDAAGVGAARELLTALARSAQPQPLPAAAAVKELG